jgi:hypothetical protein
MNKTEALEKMGLTFEGILGFSFDPQGYVSRGRFLMIGAYQAPSGEWLGMGIARIKDGAENLAWLRGIRPTNSGWHAQEVLPITMEGRTVEYLSRMYYGEGVTFANSPDGAVLHPNSIWEHVKLLPRYSREQRKPSFWQSLRWKWRQFTLSKRKREHIVM